MPPDALGGGAHPLLGGPEPGLESLRLQRYGRAWAQALLTARRFVHEFGAARVAAIGDLVHPESFGRESTIELVVWGLRGETFWRATPRARAGSVSARIHDGDSPGPRVAELLVREGIELARHGGDA